MGHRYLITGTAGFIGFHLAKALLEEGELVIGVDNLNSYYAVALKQARHTILKGYPNFTAVETDLCHRSAVDSLFQKHQPSVVCHLAAQAGVRYSLTNPFTYLQSNLDGFVNIIEMTHRHNISRFVYASSSSVYGNIKEVPYREEQRIDTPLSFYAATKCANELLAYTYSHLYQMQTIGLRIFTAYGPWGRPDMAVWKFCDAISQQQPISIYNFGNNFRDFTYVADIVSGIIAALDKPNLDVYEIFNLGNNHPESVLTVVETLEQLLQSKAQIQLLPPQPGDMVTTAANIDKARTKLGYEPRTKIKEGLANFVSWFLAHPEIVEEVRKAGCLG